MSDEGIDFGNGGPGQHRAEWDGYRNVRLRVDGKSIGLVTATYSFCLSHADRQEVARRVAALWNLAEKNGWTTEAIEKAGGIR